MKKDNSYDITKNIDVTKSELKKGTSREISLKTGEVLNVDIPKNTPNGEILKLKGLGKMNPYTNKRGDLNLVINLIDEEIEEVSDEKPVKSKKRIKNKDGEYFDPEIIDYDSVIFINSFDAENGCIKKATIPPKIKANIKIPSGVSNEEIITVNVNGLQRRVLVIICDIDYNQMENINNAVFQLETSIKLEESCYNYTNKKLFYGKNELLVKIPNFSGRKCLIYVRTPDGDVPGFKLVVTKEDGKFKFNSIFETWGTIALMVWYFGFAIDYEKFSIPDIAFYAGELIGACLIFEFIKWLIGNNKWN